MMAAVRPLNSLLEGLVPVGSVDDRIDIADVGLDSRSISSGALFLACRGRRTHGLRGAAQAIARGAHAVAYEPDTDLDPSLLAQLQASTSVRFVAVPDLSRHASRIADRFFDAPSKSLHVAGITGTNGKTTTAWLVARALGVSGTRCAYFGTLGVGEPPAIVAGEYTTADAVTVQRQLAAVREGGASCVAMEVSSHALDQHRIDAVRLRVAAFTNLTRDHLDYHGTMEAYGAAKERLFTMAELGACVINVDDDFGAQLAERHAGRANLWLIARASQGAARATALAGRHAGVQVLHAIEVVPTPRGQRLRLANAADGSAFEVPLIGDFNAENALVALGILEALGVERARAVSALAQVAAPPGRMEVIGAPDRALAIVDYAHTPDALAQALRATRRHCRGRLRVVFGCGGGRDQGKRSLMGRVAAELADDVIVTDDNPREESPTAITAAIVAGMPHSNAARVVHDREAAIRLALEESREGDVVLIAGKGHEQYQIEGDVRREFSDQRVVRAVLGVEGSHDGVLR